MRSNRFTSRGQRPTVGSHPVDSDTWGTVITVLVTGLVTGAVTLTGVGLTQHHDTALRDLDRQEQRRVEQREALAEVLVTGREWALSASSVMMTAGLLGDPIEFGKSLAVEQHGPVNTAHRRALVMARLVVREPQLFAYVTRMSELSDEMPKHIGRVHSSAKQLGKATDEALASALRHVTVYEQALDGLEQLTRDRVVNEAPARRRRLRLPWWRK
jgi:hypothetical protein